MNEEMMFTEWGNEFAKILKANLIEAGKSNTGALVNSISSEVYSTNNGVIIEISALDYLTYVDSGRRPRGNAKIDSGGFPPVSAFMDYAKGDESFAWAIARKVFRDGIPATHVIDKSISEFKNKIEDNASEAIAEQFTNIILKKLK
tara:strand:- start:334 stop:771 length:438 start_codon:yes stop_codon:yes gene_type:complete